MLAKKFFINILFTYTYIIRVNIYYIFLQIIYGAFAIEREKLPKKLNLYLYAKYALNIIIFPELVLIQKIFFWQFPPFLLQKSHIINARNSWFYCTFKINLHQ